MHEFPALLRFRCALAHLYAELGHEARAPAPLFDDLLSRDLAHEYVDAEWLFSMSLLPDSVRRSSATPGGGDAVRAAAAVRRALRAGAGRGVVRRRCAGTRRAGDALGRHDDAERHFEAAHRDRAADARAPVGGARAARPGAALLARAATPTARGALLDDAVAGYRALGMESWAERAAALR